MPAKKLSSASNCFSSAAFISSIAPDLVLAKPSSDTLRVEKGLLLSFRIFRSNGSALGSSVFASTMAVASVCPVLPTIARPIKARPFTVSASRIASTPSDLLG